MQPGEIAAYIGAAAWLPQIIFLIYFSIVKPKLLIIPNQTAEVGFTALGPIMNYPAASFGEYDPKRFKLINPTFSFKLQNVDVDQLCMNFLTINTDMKYRIMSNLPDNKPELITWQWANAVMLRHTDATP